MMLESFNDLARDFVKSVAKTFPEVEQYLVHITPESKAALDFAMKTIGDHTSLVSAKDDRLFDVLNITGLDIADMWSRIPEEQKPDLFQQLNAMVLIGTTLQNTSSELMSGIEALAEEFGDKIQDGSADITQMMGEIFSRVQRMDLSSIKNTTNLDALTNALGLDKNELNNVMGDLGGLVGIDPRLMNTVSSLVGNDGDGPDLLAMLEAAKPPRAVARAIAREQKKSRNSSNKKTHGHGSERRRSKK